MISREELSDRDTRTRMERLVRDLGNPDGLARERAREGLVALGEASLVPVVAKLREGRWRERWEAAKILREIGSPNSNWALIHALNDRNSSVRWIATEALANQGDAVLEPVLEILTRGATTVRFRNAAHHLLKHLEREGTASAIEPVLRALASFDTDGGLALAAFRGLNLLQAEVVRE
jgi:HEAT repeat protein